MTRLGCVSEQFRLCGIVWKLAPPKFTHCVRKSPKLKNQFPRCIQLTIKLQRNQTRNGVGLQLFRLVRDSFKPNKRTTTIDDPTRIFFIIVIIEKITAKKPRIIIFNP